MSENAAVILDLLRERGVDPYTVLLVERVLTGAPDTERAGDIWKGEPSEDGESRSIDGGRRVALYWHWPNWFVGYSPRNGLHASVEGPWEDWVTLARNILAADAVRPGGCGKPVENGGACALPAGHSGRHTE